MDPPVQSSPPPVHRPAPVHGLSGTWPHSPQGSEKAVQRSSRSIEAKWLGTAALFHKTCIIGAIVFRVSHAKNCFRRKNDDGNGGKIRNWRVIRLAYTVACWFTFDAIWFALFFSHHIQYVVNKSNPSHSFYKLPCSFSLSLAKWGYMGTRRHWDGHPKTFSWPRQTVRWCLSPFRMQEQRGLGLTSTLVRATG